MTGSCLSLFSFSSLLALLFLELYISCWFVVGSKLFFVAGRGGEGGKGGGGGGGESKVNGD